MTKGAPKKNEKQKKRPHVEKFKWISLATSGSYNWRKQKRRRYRDETRVILTLNHTTIVSKLYFEITKNPIRYDREEFEWIYNRLTLCRMSPRRYDSCLLNRWIKSTVSGTEGWLFIRCLISNLYSVHFVRAWWAYLPVWERQPPSIANAFVLATLWDRWKNSIPRWTWSENRRKWS